MAGYKPLLDDEAPGPAAEMKDLEGDMGENRPRTPSIDESLLQTGEEGLNDAEVARRREMFGFNELEEKTTHPLIVFLKHFWGPMPMYVAVRTNLGFLTGRDACYLPAEVSCLTRNTHAHPYHHGHPPIMAVMDTHITCLWLPSARLQHDLAGHFCPGPPHGDPERCCGRR